jgi:hypothetical protein
MEYERNWHLLACYVRLVSYRLESCGVSDSDCGIDLIHVNVGPFSNWTIQSSQTISFIPLAPLNRIADVMHRSLQLTYYGYRK